MALLTKFTKPAGSTLDVTSGSLLPAFASSAAYLLKEDYVVSDCYAQVTNASVQKGKGFAAIAFYNSPEKVKVVGNASYEFDYDINGANPIAQAYEHIKTLPEFEGAVDC